MRRYVPFVIIIAVLVAAVAVVAVVLRSKKNGAEATLFTPTAATPAPSPTQSDTPQPVSSATPTQAKDLPNVSVTVEEFGDYQCPPCGLLHPELKKIEAEYGNRIDFAFRNFPLTRNHKNAMAAAQAAEAARIQDRFMKMHDLIYENQSAWKDQDDPRPTFVKYARDLGLDMKRFTRDMDGAEVQQRIAADTQRALSLGVQGTPTILIEGQQLKAEVTNPEGIRKGIDVMLAKKAALHKQ